ncbi:MAG: hydrogenase maturation protease [Solirubrobacterales bacterium]
MSRPGYWEELERPGPDTLLVEGVELRRGSRVRLSPRGGGGDVFEIALRGRSAVVDAIEEDTEGNVQIAVTVEDDPGRDLGAARQPGHRFFFSADEVVPLSTAAEPLPEAPRVLVAGIGNVFLGDDGFGVAVVDRLSRAELPDWVRVADYGIRGMDLAYELSDYELVILVDAVPRGGPPGTVYVIEAAVDELEPTLDTHGMDPVKVLSLARELGKMPERVIVVGAEPRTVLSADAEEVVVELSEPVRAAVDEAVRTVESLLGDLPPPTGAKEDNASPDREQ